MNGRDYMTRYEMNNIVGEDLKHIPKKPEPQNLLRMTYALMRKQSLAKQARGIKSREDVLRESIAFVKKSNPQWTAQFDPGYFAI